MICQCQRSWCHNCCIDHLDKGYYSTVCIFAEVNLLYGILQQTPPVKGLGILVHLPLYHIQYHANHFPPFGTQYLTVSVTPKPLTTDIEEKRYPFRIFLSLPQEYSGCGGTKSPIPSWNSLIIRLILLKWKDRLPTSHGQWVKDVMTHLKLTPSQWVKDVMAHLQLSPSQWIKDVLDHFLNILTVG